MRVCMQLTTLFLVKRHVLVHVYVDLPQHTMCSSSEPVGILDSMSEADKFCYTHDSNVLRRSDLYPHRLCNRSMAEIIAWGSVVECISS